MKKSIIPTLSENLNEMKQTWHQLYGIRGQSLKSHFYANLRVSPIGTEI